MLDIKLFRQEDLTELKKRLASKNEKDVNVERVVELDKERRDLTYNVEQHCELEK